jgi:plasmid stabilization system protein ParE
LPRAERDTRAIARWLIRQNPVPDIVNARDLRRMLMVLASETPIR